MAEKKSKVDNKTFQLIKEHLKFLKRLEPEKIILFGSRARKDNLEESDVDLLIISKKFEGVEFRERVIQAYGQWNKKQNLDIICYTPEELKKRMNQMGIVQQAIKEGIKINE